MSIDLLLMRHREQRPFLEQSIAALAGAEGQPDERTKLERQTTLERQAKHGNREEDGYLRDDAADPQDLAMQGWGVVITDDERGERLLGAIEELRRARREQQGFEVTVFRVKPGMNFREAARWKNDVYWNSRLSRKARPRYLLALGDLDGVSLEFQQMIGLDTFMGRLAFSDPRGYASYVEKVLQWKRGPRMQHMVARRFTRYAIARRRRMRPIGNS